MQSKYEIHDAANIFPMMHDADFAAFKADIKEHGLREMVVLFDGKVIDGRNRLKACEQLGIEPDVCELEECPDPVAYVLSANLHRRHLTESQRAMCAARIRHIHDQQAKERQRGGQGGKLLQENLPEANKQARDAAGEALSVSGKSVDFATKVITNGDASVAQLVDHCQLPVSVAAKFVQVVPDKREQKKIAKHGADSVKQAIKESNLTSKPRKHSTPKSRLVLPDDPTESEVAEVEVWLERQDERTAGERFNALWIACDALQKSLIRELINESRS